MTYMSSERLRPTMEVEPATPADILDGLETLEGRSGQGTLVIPPGDGPDRFLNWALQEVTNARQAASEEQEHHCVDAVLNARRSLASLVDWYVQRDLATLCKDAPETAKQQVKFLVMRGVIDELTSRVLERAIRKRNSAEHRYISPTLAEAEDMVELLRRTVAAIRTQSPPEHGPWIFGAFLHALSWSDNGGRAQFYGWRDPIVVAPWRAKEAESTSVKYWKIIIENLRDAGWNCGSMATTDGKGRPIWVVAAERSDAGRFIVHAVQELPAFLELESAIKTHRHNHECDCPEPDEELGSNRR